MANLSAQWAQFVANWPGAALPAAVRHEAIRSIVNSMGVTIAGARDPAIDRLARALRPFAGGALATRIGHGERFDPATCAFINAASANVLDFDDTHLPTVIHPSAPVLAPLLALAEAASAPVSGIELIDAFTLGAEIACRLGNAMLQGHYERGFHITTTCGVVGAAAAAARLLRLDALQMQHALGIAASGAGGLVENLGFMAKSVAVGASARDGLLAACFAQSGMDAATSALDGVHGFLRVLSEQPDESQLVTELGERWEILNNTYKPYPCGVVLNPVIDAILDSRGRPAFRIDQIRHIQVHGNPLLLVRADRPAVVTGREAKVSLQHCVAAAVLRGKLGIAEFRDEALRDATILQLRRRVHAQADAACPVEAASVRVEFNDDTAIETAVLEARGSRKRPLEDAQLMEKFRDLVRATAPGIDAQALLDQLWSLEAVTDVRSIIRLCVPAALPGQPTQ